MPTELERRLRDSLVHAAHHFDPPSDLRERVDVRLASHHLHRNVRRVATGVAVIAVAVASVLRVVGGGEDERVAAVPSPPQHGDGWVAAADPALGWHFEHPDDWTVQHYSGQCRVQASGTLVTNLDQALQFAASPGTCTTAWDLTGVPDSFVAVEMSRLAGRASSPGNGTADTEFPLSIDDAPFDRPASDGNPAELFMLNIPVVIGGDSDFMVRVWVAPAASDQDRSAVERMVASIRPPGPATKSPPPPAMPCPEALSQPTILDSGRVCSPEAPPGNGSGPDGECTGDEANPPCGPGVVVGRFYAYTLPLRCDGLALFNGQRWVSTLPPPEDGGSVRVWMRLDADGQLGLSSPRGAISFRLDDGQELPDCRSGGR